LPCLGSADLIKCVELHDSNVCSPIDAAACTSCSLHKLPDTSVSVTLPSSVCEAKVRVYKPKQQVTDIWCIGFYISCLSRLPVADWPVRRQLNSILAGHLWRPNAFQILQKVIYFGLFRIEIVKKKDRSSRREDNSFRTRQVARCGARIQRASPTGTHFGRLNCLRYPFASPGGRQSDREGRNIRLRWGPPPAVRRILDIPVLCFLTPFFYFLLNEQV
jgi:hypothetical protein